MQLIHSSIDRLRHPARRSDGVVRQETGLDVFGGSRLLLKMSAFAQLWNGRHSSDSLSSDIYSELTSTRRRRTAPGCTQATLRPRHQGPSALKYPQFITYSI